MLPNFYYHPRMLGYNHGPQHPLKPERLRRAIELLTRLTNLELIDPGEGDPKDALRLHRPEYLDIIRELSDHPDPRRDSDLSERARAFGFGSGDNPPFLGMYEASLAYLAGTVLAAIDVRDGAPLAYGLAGGLHHAMPAKSSGFCILNDPAIAVHILREKFDRVAYVDIDVHHGDGVQWMFYDDPQVLTCSIHEHPRTLWPGTGFANETGNAFTSVNVPIIAHGTGDAWNTGFEGIILPALEAFQPQAVVLQMGTDPHELDPLAHLRLAAQEWVQAVRRIKELRIPTVAVGGGGYNLTTVPRMWVAACLILAGQEPGEIPEDLGEAWGMPRFWDPYLPTPRQIGLQEVELLIDEFRRTHLPHIPRPSA